MTAQQLWEMPGGIHPPDNKRQSTALPIQPAPLPKRLILPLNQHIGAPAEPLVRVGERVLKGQLIAVASGLVSAPLHAPTSGTVSFIGLQPYPHVSGLPAPAIVIDSDGQDEWCELAPCADYRQLQPATLLEKIRQAGISGLGGAGFPTEAKLRARPAEKISTLVINGAECEPYISADDMLMREFAAELVSGIDILSHLLQPEQVLIGIEDNKPEASAAIRAALGERPYQLREFPTRYPSGGEKQLIQILTGAEVPSGGLPADIGMLCLNVGTCVAIHNAVVLDQPLISRIVTLTGAALGRPMNVNALLGTPVGELLAFAGLQPDKLERLLMGGPMMGFTLPSMDVPLIKTSNCLLAGSREELPAPSPSMACIRCGDCAEVCPASLLPQQLHFFALGQEHEQLKAHHLFDCIECGACAYVCPSSIPLVQYYRAAKADIREQEHKQLKAEQARQRFEQRQERLRRDEQRRDAERQARLEKAERARAHAEQNAAAPPADNAIARVQAQKAGTLSDEQKRLKIAASMAQVTLKKAEKQLAAHATAELQAQVDELRQAAAAAQQALDAALAAGTTAADVAPAVDEAARKRAQIQAAMLRAQLKKTEAAAGDTPSAEQQAELERLRAELASAEQRLAASETAPTPVPADDGALKRAKIDLAMKRAELKKAEQAGATGDELQALQASLSAAEQALHAAEDASGKPVPQLVRTDKRPVDEASRALKTELAFARADLRKLEHEQAGAEVLQAARARLAEAERKLQEHDG
ncbi:electron transport complex subunit RsxC [Pseudomonas cavernae]|uniref:Ion-translocating oxidoreductase complex subunit C n=1 Tax=Pseudomonas cavernae TaxID=2320867 RepID=A0A385Z707_9PSED|nr:electron transport complex subunit RsxC [Pseudomonas cavernae]AYC33847.1 electron transport complex subunit RsxC [Pseudomonas cavernae]